jgi:hypothetical protein
MISRINESGRKKVFPKLKGFIFAVFMGVASFSASNAWGESRVGNGGDSMAALFVSEADNALQLISEALRSGAFTPPPSFSFQRFEQRIKTATVYTQDKTFLGNVEVDALNFPEENKIILNRSRWRTFSFDIKAKRFLVLHEYFGLANIRDGSYETSSFIVRKMQNGGDAGELWFLKDLAWGSTDNPFYGAYFEYNGFLFSQPRAGGKMYIQRGAVVQRQNVVEQEAFCIVHAPNTSSPVPRIPLRAVILSASEENVALPEFGNAQRQSVQMVLDKAYFTQLQCVQSVFSEAKLTVRDALDELRHVVYLNHLGAGRAGKPRECEPEGPTPGPVPGPMSRRW